MSDPTNEMPSPADLELMAERLRLTDSPMRVAAASHLDAAARFIRNADEADAVTTDDEDSRDGPPEG